MIKLSRKLLAIAVCIAVAVLIGFEMTLWSLDRITLEFETFESAKLPRKFDGATIAILSDINGDVDNLKKAIQKVESFHPDLVVFLGYLYNDTSSDDEVTEILSLLDSLDPPLGKYATLSDHDSETVNKALQSSGFKILSNQMMSVYSGTDDFINVVGFDHNLDIDSGDTFTIGLSYDPQTIDSIEGLKIDAVLSGKHHLGHINLPLIGSLLHQNEHVKRVEAVKGTTLYQTSGISTISPHVRLLSHPDVLILTLKSSS